MRGAESAGFDYGQAEVKLTAMARYAVKADAAVHPLHQRLADTQAQPCAAVPALIRTIGLGKFLEDTFAKFGADAGAMIADGHFHLSIFYAATEHDLSARRGELHRVGD